MFRYVFVGSCPLFDGDFLAFQLIYRRKVFIFADDELQTCVFIGFGEVHLLLAVFGNADLAHADIVLTVGDGHEHVVIFRRRDFIGKAQFLGHGIEQVQVEADELTVFIFESKGRIDPGRYFQLFPFQAGLIAAAATSAAAS